MSQKFIYAFVNRKNRKLRPNLLLTLRATLLKIWVPEKYSSPALKIPTGRLVNALDLQDMILQVSAKATTTLNNIEKSSFVVVCCVTEKFAGSILPLSKMF